MKTATFIIAGVIFGLLTFAAGLGLFVSGIIAGSTISGHSSASCAALRVHEDCQDKCGCGWCNYGNSSSQSTCQPVDNYHCSAGTFDSDPSERCQQQYDNCIIAVIVLASLFGLFGLITTTSCVVACNL
jgi:hypothetical protein